MLKKIRTILLILASAVIVGLLMFVLIKHFIREEPDPLLEPSGFSANGEELDYYAREAYDNTLKYMFPEAKASAEVLFSDGYTVAAKDHIPIVMKHDEEGKETEAYEFQKSIQRRTLEGDGKLKYTGNITDDVISVLSLFTGTEFGNDEDLDSMDAPVVEGLKAFSYESPYAIAITDSVKFRKGVLRIGFHTVDIDDPDGSKQEEAEKNGEDWISSSGYNASAAAYTYCEECLGYLLLFPEYIDRIDEIEIKGEGFAPMHCNRDYMSCTYSMAEGQIYETWRGYLIEGDITPEFDMVYIPLEVSDPEEAKKQKDIEEKRSGKTEALFTEETEEKEEKSMEIPGKGILTAVIPVIFILFIVLFIIPLIGQWKVYTKTGLPGWVSLVPILNAWALFEMTTGSGVNMFFTLIPIYGIIVIFKVCLRLAEVFGRGILFGLGLFFLYPIFITILGFSDAQYLGIDDVE